MTRRALLVFREERFSPGKVHQDATILELVAAELRGVGFETAFYRGEELAQGGRPEPLILTMGQGVPALTALGRWKGSRIINPPRAVRNTLRRNMVRLLGSVGVGLPPTKCLRLGELRAADLQFDTGGVWLKRGDVHAMEASDVVFVRNGQEARRALGSMRRRGIEHVCVQRHVDGTTVKFYALVDGSFFRVVDDCPIPYDQGESRDLALRAGRALGLEVFGGDFQIGPDGSIHLIDLNDWPSFSRCSRDAARAIARYAAEAS